MRVMRRAQAHEEPTVHLMHCRAGCLAEHLEDLLDVGPELLSQLPWTWKAPLLAVARRTVQFYPLHMKPSVQSLCLPVCYSHSRSGLGSWPSHSVFWCALTAQGALTDEALSMLVDEDFVSLDLAHASALTHRGISAAVGGLPLLRTLDLSHTAFLPSALPELAETCPLLEILRLGGLAPKSTRAAVATLLCCLPRLQQADVAESWEDLAETSAAQVLCLHQCNRPPAAGVHV